jgi:glutamyl-tRNA synthetase
VTESGRIDGVRCRLAPAPTGYLHVGNARTALFNWLFARHHEGTFVLRIEDTDQKRSTDEAIQIVIGSLRWLGIDWDEGPEVGGPFGPYRQTERMELYHATTARFIEDGRAYHCYCTPEELEDRRRAALKRGETPGYDGRCRNLSPEERRAFEAEGRPRAVRFAMPGTDIVFDDLLRGQTHFPANDLRDFVILRSDATPTYLLAAAVDDVAMEMTHVIRGEDLLPSTPRQLEIMKAVGATAFPAFAHVPLIVGPDRQPLSKRHGSVAVEWFREHGFVPEAMVNYLALLGWSYDEATTFFDRAQLVERFDLSRVSRNPAAFDLDKLRWMNGHYIRERPDQDLVPLVADALGKQGLEPDEGTVISAVPLIKERMHTVVEGAGLIRFLFEDPMPDEKAARMLGPDRADYLREVASRLEAIEDWRASEIESVLRELKESRELSSNQAFQPVRAAVTGTLVSPPLFESLELLGRDLTLERLRRAAGATDSTA